MPPPTLFCPGGTNSQTGEAAKERYRGASITDCGTIADVLALLDNNEGPYVIPMWNSHVGEVPVAKFIWDHVEESKIKLSDLWAKKIEFWFVKKTGIVTSHGKIGSVGLATTQCKDFLQKQNATIEAYALTNLAFEAYKNGAALDGVLVAPNQGENAAGFEVVSRRTANTNNFTSFVRFVPSRAFKDDNSANSLTGVTMRSYGTSLTEAQQSFFTELFSGIKSLEEIPKLIFVLKRTAKVGLLFEGPRLYASDLLEVNELEKDEIKVYEGAGATAKSYTSELRKLFEDEFPELNRGDFILHHGVDTWLFACPPLGLYTHGYEKETVESGVRFYISQIFQLWKNGMQCTPAQDRFFKRHEKSWLAEGSKFMQFAPVNPTGG